MIFLDELYQFLFWGMIFSAPVVFVVLLYVPAPYGRYARPGWGPLMDNRLGWLVMESPACLLMLVPFLFIEESSLVLFFLFLWQFHYVHRSFVYPFGLKKEPKIPIIVVVMAFTFNIFNAFINGFYLSQYSAYYDYSWIYSSNFIVGLAFFLWGFWANKRSDQILYHLKKGKGHENYGVPDQFLYRYISCPNYFSESIQWLGWAIMTMAPPAWVFFLWTVANLFPRAVSHHAWYRKKFGAYPKNRKAFIPFFL
ncbi:MAG: hypothetical protein CMQ40_10100 [Gammaproteobacteria bacterium]|nr:hypothetical protein [Gammaproteobacteria bacterium]|tara:strand:+ start:248 stop:1006 length:759 start_codon:yes stop_codon:yes gene_type:complete